MTSFAESGIRSRWSDKESSLLVEIRKRLHSKLIARPQYPEVVGDRKLIRFLRGHDYNIDKACEMIEKYLDWRIDNNVDAIRHNIVERGMNSVIKFPNADKILSLCKFLVIDESCLSTEGHPIMAEGILPFELWDKVTVEEYLQFRLYGLELVSLLLEQMSYKKEQQILDGSIITDNDKPYGFLQQIQVLRDVNGIGIGTFQGTNKEAFQRTTAMSGDNYPEILYKVHIVNAPWVFGGIWNIAQVFLAPKTVSKVKVLGSDFIQKIGLEIENSCIPKFLGGNFEVNHALEFVFDTENALKELPVPALEADQIVIK